MRVAHIVGRMCGDESEQVIMNYFRAIDREKVQFDIFLSKGSTKVPVDEIKALGGKLYVLPSLKKKQKYAQTLCRLLAEDNYEVVHCHLGIHSAPALKAAKKAGVSTRILHCHSTDRVSKLDAVLRVSAKRYATHLLACSQFAARRTLGALPLCRIGETPPNTKHVKLLPNAIDTEKFRYDEKKRSELRGEFKIPSKTLVFGHIGNFNGQENQGFLIDIFKSILAKHKNSALMLVGEGKDTELIKARVIAAGLSGKVIFTGAREDTDKLYSAFDCFLLPSRREELPLTAIEAQCAGLYCLFSEKISQEAEITDSAQRLSLKSSAEDWAFAALNLARLRNNSAAEQITLAGADITTAAKELESFYLSL